MLTIKCSKGSFLSLVNALSEPSFERLIKLSFDMWFKEWFFNQINVDNTTVDFDSTVITAMEINKAVVKDITQSGGAIHTIP